VKACHQERDEAAKRIDIVSEGGSLASLLLGRDEACSSLHEKTFPLAGRIRHLKIEQPGMAGLVDANIPRRQIAVNYPRRVQGPERFGDCRDIVDDCSPGRFVQTPERAGRALGNVAPLDMVERKEQTVALL